MSAEPRNCTRCGELLPADAFYFISKSTGKRRGQCKPCMAEVKAEQRDPAWLPTCSRCGNLRPRLGPGRRLCGECFDAIYEEGTVRARGSHRLRLNPCRACGAKRLREDHVKNTALCPVCRSVPQHRRKTLKAMGLTPPEYLALLASQGHACGVCRRPFNTQRRAHLDHRHPVPRIVRGAVCNSCNTLLGLANESAELLANAIAYLESPPAQAMFPGREATEAANRAGMSWNRLTRVAAVVGA